MMCALVDVARQRRGARASSSACPTRSPRTSSTARPTRSSPRACGRLRDHRRADRPAHRRPGQGRARDPPRGARDGRARLDAVARRQRDPQGARRLPSNRDAAVQPRVLRPVRPPLDQPRADRRRRRVQQGPRPLRDRRRHPLPPQPGPRRRSSRQIRAIADLEVVKCFTRAPAIVLARRTRTSCALRDAVGRSIEGEALSVGRDGASDAVSFLEAGVPAVEFGPIGGGHHGPEEWVSIASLRALPRRRSATSSPGCPRALDVNGADEPSRRARFYTARPVTAVAEKPTAPPPRRRPADAPCASRWAAVADRPARRRGGHDRPAPGGQRDGQAFVRETIPIRGVQNVLDDVDAGQAADDPGPRLRPALRARAQQAPARALGHDDARPAGPEQERDRGHVDPARPQGRRSPATAPTRSTRPTRSAARSSPSRRSAAC